MAQAQWQLLAYTQVNDQTLSLLKDGFEKAITDEQKEKLQELVDKALKNCNPNIKNDSLQAYLARLYLKGNAFVIKDEKKAFEHLIKANNESIQILLEEKIALGSTDLECHAIRILKSNKDPLKNNAD